MKITFLGATHEVTGSCTLIETKNFKLLVDCGMEQGADIFQNKDLPCNAVNIDAILVTHAHIDHTGKLPLLYKEGFRGKIYSTPETASLCDIMLRDSAHIQSFEAKWRNRRAKRSGADEYIPIYSLEDAVNTARRFIPCDYGDVYNINENICVRFSDIGHLLGSACIEVWIKEDGDEKKIVFSGDIGNTGKAILKEPSKINEADYVIIESTYGDRLHPEKPDYISLLAKYIDKATSRGGNVIIPSFAVGRTQEMLYFIRQIKESNLVKYDFPVYVDSPLANEATEIFLQSNTECFDEETKEMIDNGINPLRFDGLHISVTSDDSKAINADKRPKVIISASGMCEAGRVRHHLKHNLWREDSLILFVGYQAAGTLGRNIYEGAQTVRLFGEEISVNAEIAYLPGISGHADKNGLIDWLSGFKKKPSFVFVNHGEDNSCTSFANELCELGYKAQAPYSGSIFDLIQNRFIQIEEGVRIEKKPDKTARKNTVFQNLLKSLSRLDAVVRGCEGMANKDLAKLQSQLDNLSDKWQR